MEYFFEGRYPVKIQEPDTWATDIVVVTSIQAKDEQEARDHMKHQLQVFLDMFDTVRLIEGKVNVEQKLAHPITL